MADGNSGMVPLQQFRNRSADNFATAQNDSPGANHWHTTAFDQLDAAMWCAWNEASQIANCCTTFILGMQANRPEIIGIYLI